MSFADTWLPNIVCTITGIIVSGLVGFWQGRRAARTSDQHTAMLTNRKRHAQAILTSSL
jgi:hypothetical protein